MVGWHNQLSGPESEQILGDSEGQGSLMCCSPWGCRVGHDLVTEQQQPGTKIPHAAGQLNLSPAMKDPAGANEEPICRY